MKQINDFKRPEPIPGFSCIEMKERIQEKLYEETKHMTIGEMLAYFDRKVSKVGRLGQQEVAKGA